MPSHSPFDCQRKRRAFQALKSEETLIEQRAELSSVHFSQRQAYHSSLPSMILTLCSLMPVRASKLAPENWTDHDGSTNGSPKL